MPSAFFLWIVAINLLTLLRFWQDKQRAIAGTRRVPEGELLRLAFLGGAPAAFAARRLFRHKTRKQPFSSYLMLILAAQTGIAVALFVASSAD